MGHSGEAVQLQTTNNGSITRGLRGIDQGCPKMLLQVADADRSDSYIYVSLVVTSMLVWQLNVRWSNS